MGAYFEHWLEMGRKGDADKLPKIFYVNWFRKDADGKFIWPGFGENSRVLEWVFRRCNGESEVVETPIGYVPAAGELNVDGLDISDAELEELMSVDGDKVAAELPQVEEHLARFENLPSEIQAHLDKLKTNLRLAPQRAEQDRRDLLLPAHHAGQLEIRPSASRSPKARVDDRVVAGGDSTVPCSRMSVTISAASV